MFRHALHALLAAGLVQSARSQPVEPPKLALRALALGPLGEEQLWLKDGEAYVPLEFSNFQPSAAQGANLASPLPVFRGPLDPQGKPSSSKPFSVAIPANATRVLLLAWPTAEGTGFQAVPDNFSAAGPADWLLVNTTRHPLVFQLGAEARPLRIQAAQHVVHRVTTTLGEGAAVKVAMPDEDQWKVIYSTYWPVDARQRSIVLFVDDGRKIRVKLILDESRGSDQDQEEKVGK